MGRRRHRAARRAERLINSGGADSASQLHGDGDEINTAGTSNERVQRFPKHPPGLTGKAIGLYYRDLARQKPRSERKAEKRLRKEERKKMKKDIIPLQIGASTEYKIRSLIDAPRGYDELSDFYSFEERQGRTHIDSQFKKKYFSLLNGSLESNLERALSSRPKLQQSEALDVYLYDELEQKRATNQYKYMLNFRRKLPAYEQRKEILDLIYSNRVVLISGETGCGKTTQVAQFILDYEIERGRGSTTSIACTQPRRISAISVAERVASERADQLGNSVGFHIRLEKVLARPQGSITFCTTGMLLQLMQLDPALQGFSHIILDEIHERSTQSDFILTLLKRIIPKRPELKVILMSATLNSEQFSAYYNDCPMIHIPGFTYPVEEFYLEDVIAITKFRFPTVQQLGSNGMRRKGKQAQKKWDQFQSFIGPYIRHLDGLNNYPKFVLEELRNPKSEDISLELICDLCKHICTKQGPGAILIFLPGLQDISKLNRMMLDSGSFPRDKFSIYPLHSRMPTVDQKAIFNVPPAGIRKIIIATIIAETSITIEDVVYVIDCGKTKLSSFDVENNLQTLEPEWVSEANARQRRGRAGRVRPGKCYHLFSKARAAEFDRYPLPEMLRTRLEEVILQVKILQIGKAEPFLAEVMDPPNPQAIHLSLNLLEQLEAIDQNEDLTPLGYHLAKLPLDPRTGKMILWAAMFSCIDPVFAIAASLSFKDAFYCPFGKEEEARQKKLELGLNQYSDHLALAEALKQFEERNYRGNAWAFCQEYFLSFNTLKLLSEMKEQFARYLYEMHFLRNENPLDELANRNSHNKSLIKAIVCAGLYPNIAIVKRATGKGVKAITIEKESVQLHPCSINERVKKFPSPYLTYFLKRKSTGIYLFDTTTVSPVALLFASPSRSLGGVGQDGKSVITIANGLTFVCESSAAHIIHRLHDRLDRLLEFKVTHPETINWNAYEGNILKAIMELLSDGDENIGLDSGRYHDWSDFDEDCMDSEEELDPDYDN